MTIEPKNVESKEYPVNLEFEKSSCAENATDYESLINEQKDFFKDKAESNE